VVSVVSVASSVTDMHFSSPEALLLVPPALIALRRFIFAERRAIAALRCVLVLLAAALLAGPSVTGGTTGRDLILVVDRSRSVGDGHGESIAEIAALAAKAARRGDRIGHVVFGRDAAVAAAPVEDYRSDAAPARAVDRDATDLAGAVRLALSLVPEGRRGSLLVLSDGEDPAGADALAAAAALARERGVRIDVQALRRPGGLDVAVVDVAPPLDVAVGEPFAIPAWVATEVPADADWRLVRDGEVVAGGKVPLGPGRTRILARDRLERPGIHRYRFEVAGAAPDRVPENDRAAFAVRAIGPPRILCVTPGGREDRLTRSLGLGGLEVVVAAPGTAPLTLDALEGFRAVVVENVPAGDLRPGGLLALARFVEELGGGVLLTGGKASFGQGGYRRSRLEDVLPVTMEVRREQRRFSVAMALVLDRSGSMAVEAGGGSGLTKMDLANRGACAAIELLTPMDSVAVIAVDSAPHVVVPLGRVEKRDLLLKEVLGIRSGGGGIFMGVGVHAAADELDRAVQQARHIVVFADAADAEEPADLDRFVPDLARRGVTVSVIALGSENDPDAELLRRIAADGGGRCSFVTDPADLPRVFAEEALKALRSAIVEEPTDVDVLPPVAALGAGLDGPFPRLGGYSIAYARPEAEVAARSRDDVGAPILAYRHHRLGRSAAFLGEADGELSGDLARFAGYGDLFTALARWLAGAEPPAEVSASVSRRGGAAVVAVEAAEGAEALLARIDAQVSADDGRARPVELVRVGPGRLEGRVELPADQVLRPIVRVGDGAVIRLPPVALPLSTELAPAIDPRAGERALRRLATLTGGRLDPPATELLDGPREGRGGVDLSPLVAALATALLLGEIAVRRLHIALSWPLGRAAGSPARTVRPTPTPTPTPTLTPTPTPTQPFQPLGTLIGKLPDGGARPGRAVS